MPTCQNQTDMSYEYPIKFTDSKLIIKLKYYEIKQKSFIAI